MNSEIQAAKESHNLPGPVPELADLHREREAGGDPAHLVRLGRNERLGPLPEWFLEELRQAVQSEFFTNYPSDLELYERLSEATGLKIEQLLLTPGSDAAFKALYHAYLNPGDTVATMFPSYAMYEVYAQMFEAKVAKTSFDENLGLDFDRLLESIVPGVRLVVIANPNQPTGTLLEEEEILRLVQRAGEAGALLAVDEAYYPFSRMTVLPLVKEVPNLVVMRTFSKAAGLASMRVGFVAGHEEVISNLYKVRSVHDINGMGLLCANQILKHPRVVDDYVDEVEAGGKLLTERAKSLGLEPVPTRANFMLIRVAHLCRPGDLVKSLEGRGYLVKGPFGLPCLADCIRVTLGPPDLMERFSGDLERALAEVKGA